MNLRMDVHRIGCRRCRPEEKSIKGKMSAHAEGLTCLYIQELVPLKQACIATQTYDYDVIYKRIEDLPVGEYAFIHEWSLAFYRIPYSGANKVRIFLMKNYRDNVYRWTVIMSPNEIGYVTRLVSAIENRQQFDNIDFRTPFDLLENDVMMARLVDYYNKLQQSSVELYQHIEILKQLQ